MRPACAAGISGSRPNICGVSGYRVGTMCPRRPRKELIEVAASDDVAACNRCRLRRCTDYQKRNERQSAEMAIKKGIGMAIDLVDYDRKAREAVQAFWGNREKARQKQIESGKADQGERAGVTAGKNMDGFIALVIDIVRANGLKNAEVHQKGRVADAAGLLPSNQVVGHACNQQRASGRRCGVQKPGRAFLWQKLQQSRRGDHRHRSRFLDRIPRRRLR